MRRNFSWDILRLERRGKQQGDGKAKAEMMRWGFAVHGFHFATLS